MVNLYRLIGLVRGVSFGWCNCSASCLLLSVRPSTSRSLMMPNSSSLPVAARGACHGIIECRLRARESQFTFSHSTGDAVPTSPILERHGPCSRVGLASSGARICGTPAPRGRRLQEPRPAGAQAPRPHLTQGGRALPAQPARRRGRCGRRDLPGEGDRRPLPGDHAQLHARSCYPRTARLAPMGPRNRPRRRSC